MFFRRRYQPAPIEVYCGQRKIANAPTLRWAMQYCYHAPKGENVRVYQGDILLWQAEKT